MRRSFPKAVDVTLVEGAVSSQDDLEQVHTIRQRSKLLVALGDCAVTGNVPAMRNSHPGSQTCWSASMSKACRRSRGVPARGVPALLRQAVPVHEVVKVDLHVPGCPPSAGLASPSCSANCSKGACPTSASKVKFG